MHLAAALGVPVVALFGEEAPALWGPYTDAPYRVLRALDERGRCSPGAVPPATVLAAADELLGERLEAAA
jgi:ADP-heptose:LPS heptosyltransferase